jgi:hypothetical protein
MLGHCLSHLRDARRVIGHSAREEHNWLREALTGREIRKVGALC